MIQVVFPKNKVLHSMSYTSNGDLSILFCKGQTRVYHGVEKSIAYGLYYKTNATDLLSYYSTNIKKKHNVTVK